MSNPTSTLQEIFDRTRQIYLNDAEGRVWLNNKLLPFFKASYDNFQTELQKNDIESIDAIADPLIIPAGTVVYNPLPLDFVWPIRLEERDVGSTGLYSQMQQLRFNINITPSPRFIYWSFYGDAITFPEATTDRDVLLYYQQLYPPLAVGSGDPVIDNTTAIFGHSLSAISARMGDYINRFVNQNLTFADICNQTWKEELFNVINIYVKKKQAIPSRPRPFRASGNGWWNTF